MNQAKAGQKQDIKQDPKKDTRNKFGALWVSHSSMGDFLKCPRAYYLHNVYKDPKTGRKISTVSPAMSLGQAVHGTLEPLALVPAEKRIAPILDTENFSMGHPLLDVYEKEWKKVSGLVGGFEDPVKEEASKERGRNMILRVIKNPGPIAQKALRLKAPDDLPFTWITPEDNIILCGKIDWLMYVPEDDSAHILDFKTGKNEENDDSLQLPIYTILLNDLQKRKVSGASYWYLDKDDTPVPKKLPSLEEARARVFEVAKEMEKSKLTMNFKCPYGESGCFACAPYERILRGEGKYVGVGGYGRDLYIE